MVMENEHPVEWTNVEIINFNERRQIAQLEASLDLYQERIAELEFAQEDWGWTRISGEDQWEFSRDHLLRMIARSRLFFLQNPLIRRGVTLQSDYVFAQGLNIQGTNEVVNGAIQEFLDDPLNQKEFVNHKARLGLEQTLIVDGNVFFVLFTDKANTGMVNIRTIPIDEICEIVCNPDDCAETWYYKREWLPINPDGSRGEQQTVYYPDIDYFPTTIVPPSTLNGKKILWDAPIIHVKTGSLAKSKFGAPETYSALSWAQSHKQMLENWATIIAAYARFAFRLTTPGGKNSVQAATSKLQTRLGTGNSSLTDTNPSPIAGSIWARTKDGPDIEPIKTSGATTSAKDARELRIMVAAAMGLPDPMLSGEVDVGNLATAKTLDRPTELKFRSRQKLWEDVNQKIIAWVVRWSIEARNGLLHNYVAVSLDNRGRKQYKPKRDPKTKKPIELHVETVFPPILEKSIQERIDAVIGAVTLNGKTFALESPELKKLTIRLMLQALGVSDVDELVETIFKGLSDEELKSKPNDPTGNNNEPEPEPTPEPEPEEVRGA